MGEQGFTLAEVCVSLSLVGVVFAGVLWGYCQVSDRAQWSAYSLAAQSLAVQGLEQARGAKWDPLAFPPVDELVPGTQVQVAPLDLPVAGQPIWATNYIQVSPVQAMPPLRQIEACCVWSLPWRSEGVRGPFTNRVVTLRAPDQ